MAHCNLHIHQIPEELDRHQDHQNWSKCAPKLLKKGSKDGIQLALPAAKLHATTEGECGGGTVARASIPKGPLAARAATGTETAFLRPEAFQVRFLPTWHVPSRSELRYLSWISSWLVCIGRDQYERA